jgi:hypothetical protein
LAIMGGTTSKQATTTKRIARNPISALMVPIGSKLRRPASGANLQALDGSTP